MARVLLASATRTLTRPRSRAFASFHMAAPAYDISNTTSVEAMTEHARFGPHTIRRSEIFATSEASFAFVNLKPLVPGHVLVCPMRVCDRFRGLAAHEVGDMWLLAQEVADFVEDFFAADAMSLVIQDGAAAGQTVPHVHIHILPRYNGDLENNDEIYDMINDASKEEAKARKFDLDQERVVKTPNELADEAKRIRSGLQEWKRRKYGRATEG